MNKFTLQKERAIILIAGGSGSGKTFFVNKLIEAFGSENCCVISEDNYYKDLSHLDFKAREKINYDAPEAKDFNLLFRHISELKNGNQIDIPDYDFTTHTRKPRPIRIQSKNLILIEGILILHDLKINALADLKIYIDTPGDLRLIRRIRRDINERGRSLESVFTQYQNSVRPMFEKYVYPCKETADLVINGERYKPGIEEKILEKLNQNVLRKSDSG